MRKIWEQSAGNRMVRGYWDYDWNEYRVRLFINGHAVRDSDYFTDDESDMRETGLAILAEQANPATVH